MSSVSAPNPTKDSSAPSPQDTDLRYAAYANRLRTIMRASHRYVAYTSDIGESFRPLAHPYLVKFGYAISWAYILGDVLYASWVTKLKSEGRYTPGLRPWLTDIPPKKEGAILQFPVGSSIVDTDWRWAGLKRGIFQSIASMGLPAFTIHSAVRYSSILFKNSLIKALRTYGPVAIGLGIVPLLPYVFDEPVEHAVDYVFEKAAQSLVKQ